MPLVLSGSVDISGSMTATTILVSSPGAAGMVSSSAQITELAPLMAYTASLKSAAIVSSSQQIQNYNLFAVTSSANTFYGNQTIPNIIGTTITTPTGLEYQIRNTNGASGDHIFKSYNTQILKIDGGNNKSSFNGDVDITGSVIITSNSRINGVITLGGSNTLQTTDSPHLFRIAGGGLGISANNEGTGAQPIKIYTNGSQRIQVTGDGATEVSGSLTTTSDIITQLASDSSTNLFKGTFVTANGSGAAGKVRFGGGEGGQFRAYMEAAQVWNGTNTDTNLNFFTTQGGVGGTQKMSIGSFGIQATGSINVLQGDIIQNTFLSAAAIFYNSYYKARGTSSSPTALANADLIGGLSAHGYDGSAYRNFGRLEFKVTDTVSSGTLPTSCRILTGNTSAAQTFIVDNNGNVGAPSGTNIYNASDARLKQNISSISGSLNSVMGLNPVKFNWIDNFVESENGKDMLGFVAQEVQTIVPEAVEGFGAGSILVNGTEVTNPLRVNEKFLIPVLTNAIQEQQSIIDSLIARIEALENN